MRDELCDIAMRYGLCEIDYPNMLNERRLIKDGAACFG